MFTACSVCSCTNAIHQAVKVSKQGDDAGKSVFPEPRSLEEHCFGLRSQPEAWDLTRENGSLCEALASSPRAAYTGCDIARLQSQQAYAYLGHTLSLLSLSILARIFFIT